MKAMEEAIAARDSTRYVLRLYIAGPTPLSTRAIVNTRRICEEHLKDRYDLEVVDICLNPLMATSEQIIAAPTLIKKHPLPSRRFVGDMSKTTQILAGLDLTRSGGTENPATGPQ